nr:RNA-dependent RNA polymerase NS5B [Hepacivirus macronycteridis]
SASYAWNGLPISGGKPPPRPVPVASVTGSLARFRNIVYYTDRRRAGERAAKVTVEREQTFDGAHLDMVRLAKKRAQGVSAKRLSWDEVAKLTPARTARSTTGVTGPDIRVLTAKARRHLNGCWDSLPKSETPIPVTCMAKEEIFCAMREKQYTRKPPRLIMFPDLIVRATEKAVLGDLAPKVVKAVLKDEYGFAYTPKERVEKILTMWHQTKNPVAFTCDTVCFDSTVTPEDIDIERDIYLSASMPSDVRERTRALHDRLYKGGPIHDTNGKEIGWRNCRASGVYTTSSSNCLTAWIKVHAAARKAGMGGLKLLVTGDDVFGVFESSDPTTDREKLAMFEKNMLQYGAPQGECQLAYNLEELTCCSSNISVCCTNKGVPYYYLTRDPRTPFARSMVESTVRNPTNTWIGNIIAMFPALWVRTVLVVQLLSIAMQTGTFDNDYQFEMYGVSYTIKLKQLPEIIAAIHGPEVFRLHGYTPREVSRIAQALREVGSPSIKVWKSRAKHLRAQMIRKGGAARHVATYLLAYASEDKRSLAPLHKSKFDPKHWFMAHGSSVAEANIPVTVSEVGPSKLITAIGVLAVAILALFAVR